MSDSYYRTIKGKQFDRQLLEIAEKASQRSKAPLSKNVAKNLFDTIVDGNEYTDVEKRTVKYIRDNYNFTPEADEYLRTEIRKWAAKISVPSAKKSKKTSKPSPKKSKSKAKPKEESNDTSYFHVFDSNSDDDVEPTPEYNELVELNKYGKKEKSPYLRYVFLGIVILIVICLFFLIRSCKSDTTKSSNVTVSEPNSKAINQNESSAKAVKREQLLPHTEIGKGTVTLQFIKRLDAIRYINTAQIKFIKQSLNVGDGASNELANLAEALKKYPEIKVRVKGHTCFIGELDENKILSEERAKLIQDELIKLGVNAKQLEARGFGETTNIDTNYTEQGRIKNRRVDFTVLSVNEKN
ncbi:hypothetical protein LPTSP4_26420 [Leptospira ryugenii]|uniref:OmpA-like domain-containing protein n=1 Tax=Leptospira ryugenii TaxID=1917863 RepID=A0A2P2E2L1_9LEPT|nr:OmpA family protein [Leptospira ryugenii]GBF51111.1 hypothetical protein LPTSP4_26420 [Leptospira ryugenii]